VLRFDVFPYAAEATPPEILLLRLAELDPWADMHLIVEANQTFSGSDRELSWPELSKRREFAEYAPKVVLATFDFPEGLSTWGRDRYHRGACAQAVGHYLSPMDTDLVLFADADEIPRPATLFGTPPGVKLPGRYHEWHLDLAAVGSPSYLWEFRQPALVTWRTLRQYGGEHIRDNSGHMPAAHGQTGWHFTLQGGAAACTRKLNAYAHTELASLTEYDVQLMISKELDVLDRCGLVRVPLAELPPSWERVPYLVEWLLPRTRVELEASKP
jgi:hypothetical protein